MKKAVTVFGEVLGKKPAAAASSLGKIHRGVTGTEGAFAASAHCLVTLFRPGQTRPGPLRDRRQPLVDELLQAPALVGLGRVDVALRIGRDAVDGEELAGLPAAVAEARQDLQRLAIA